MSFIRNKQNYFIAKNNVYQIKAEVDRLSGRGEKEKGY